MNSTTTKKNTRTRTVVLHHANCWTNNGTRQDIMLMHLKQKKKTHTFVQTNKQSVKGKSLLFFYITHFSILHLAYYLTGAGVIIYFFQSSNKSRALKKAWNQKKNQREMIKYIM